MWLLLASLLWVAAEAELMTNEKPNIVFVVLDDVGWADLSYAGTGVIQTPVIDGLAKRGLKLSNHYVHPTCTPTRASLLTGLYSYKTGLSFAIVPGSPAGLDEHVVTMPRVFRNAGYRAYASGKW
jgi:arylsulfatase A-like enzyme